MAHIMEMDLEFSTILKGSTNAFHWHESQVTYVDRTKVVV